MQKNITLPFLGKRVYLHGSTLLDTLLEFVEIKTSLDFKFKTIITSNQLRIEVGDAATLEAQQPDVFITWHNGEQARAAAAFALPPLESALAIPYPEEEVMQAAPFVDDQVVYDKPWPMSFADTLFCLLKKLEIQYKKNDGGMWLFSGMQLNFIPAINTVLAVKKVHLLPNARLLRMSLAANGTAFGTAYTSWVPQEKLNFLR